MDPVSLSILCKKLLLGHTKKEQNLTLQNVQITSIKSGLDPSYFLLIIYIFWSKLSGLGVWAKTSVATLLARPICDQ